MGKLILITGIGNVGKSALRRLFVNFIRSAGTRASHFDADDFKKVRREADRDCLSEFANPFESEVLIVEDVHATVEEAVLPLDAYDCILYVQASNVFSHFIFWLPLAWRWFQYGWDIKKSWEGTGVRYDPRNLFPISRELWSNFKKGKELIAKDMNTLKSFKKTIFIRSFWTRRGCEFRFE
ncbi:TPA: hypothetical protein DEP58_04970 [Patescibacteria group bacterium]|nr:MAG: hypothetical protein UU98_C0004G0031 [Parcubacteria group bacterium GW2011_GWD2_42_14]HCC05617.1 hypothetical protein [Patescibacteria group bacterium]